MIHALRCNSPLVVRQFVECFPTVPQMLSPHGRAFLLVWESGKLLTTKQSEMGHASERRSLASANAPGKSFAKHSHREYLQRLCRLFESRTFP